MTWKWDFARLRFGVLQGVADLTGANLGRTTFCSATIDGAIIAPDDIGGPGYILYALTADEAAAIERGRA